LQQSKAASKGQTGTNLKTAWTKEERHSESEMVAQPAPEPVPEPPAASSLSVSCGCSSWDSRFNGLRIPSEPRELGSVEAAVNDVVQPSTTCNESTIPVVQDLRHQSLLCLVGTQMIVNQLLGQIPWEGTWMTCASEHLPWKRSCEHSAGKSPWKQDCSLSKKIFINPPLVTPIVTMSCQSCSVILKAR